MRAILSQKTSPKTGSKNCPTLVLKQTLKQDLMSCPLRRRSLSYPCPSPRPRSFQIPMEGSSSRFTSTASATGFTPVPSLAFLLGLTAAPAPTRIPRRSSCRQFFTAGFFRDGRQRRRAIKEQRSVRRNERKDLLESSVKTHINTFQVLLFATTLWRPSTPPLPQTFIEPSRALQRPLTSLRSTAASWPQQKSCSFRCFAQRAMG